MAQFIDIIKNSALNLYDLIVDGVPASLTGSTIDHLGLLQPQSPQLQGVNLYIYSGAGAGQERIVGSFSPTNHRLCFPQVFGSVPSLNSNFILTKRFPKSQYDNAIKRAIGIARMKHFSEYVATMALAATQYEYPVPSGMEYINTLRLVPSGNTYYANDAVVDTVFEIPPRVWRIERNYGGSYVISIDPRKINLGGYDKYICRVNGQAKPDIQATDNATIPAQLEEYLTAQTSMLMAALITDQAGKADSKFYLFRDMVKGTPTAPGLEDYITSHIRGKQVGS